MSFNPIYHRDGTVTYWSVYRQVWVSRASGISDEEYAAMDSRTRSRVKRHIVNNIDDGDEYKPSRYINGIAQ